VESVQRRIRIDDAGMGQEGNSCSDCNENADVDEESSRRCVKSDNRRQRAMILRWSCDDETMRKEKSEGAQLQPKKKCEV
jgi:hypothetical protein